MIPKVEVILFFIALMIQPKNSFWDPELVNVYIILVIFDT